MNSCPCSRVIAAARRRAATLLLAAALLGASGCSSVPSVSSVTEPFSRETATVKVPFQGETAKVVVRLAHFPANQQAVDGLDALQNEDLETALTRFKAAVAEKPDNWTYQFAIAVTYEALGHDADAKRHYENTNLLKGKEGYFDAHAGLKRIAAREEAAHSAQPADSAVPAGTP